MGVVSGKWAGIKIFVLEPPSLNSWIRPCKVSLTKEMLMVTTSQAQQCFKTHYHAFSVE